MEQQPKFEHDCKRCIFLGRYADHDLYYHPGDHESVVARWGDDGPDYTSGLGLSQIGRDINTGDFVVIEPLLIARLVAEAMGFL